jgi:alpha-tubulin suppressor-like RCC1 family protein
MPLLSSVRRLRAASILPLLALAAACDGDPSGIDPQDRPVSLAAGEAHGCAVTGSGAAYCWGLNDRGQLGDGTSASSAAPVRVLASEPFTSISASARQTCAVGASGAVYCWGLVAYGPGIQTIVHHMPSRVETELRFAQVSAGVAHACALTATGKAYCWGVEATGQRGDGPGGPAYSSTPVPVSTEVEFASIQAVALHTCGLAKTGAVYCWGSGESLAFLVREPIVHAPAGVLGSRRFTSLGSGGAWACGVSKGEVYCDGRNHAGELGFAPSFGPRLEEGPFLVDGLPDIRDVFSSGQNWRVGQVCALEDSGEAHCWGENAFGEVGIEPDDERTVTCFNGFNSPCVPGPENVAASLRFRTLALGTNHTCGITREHEIHCWGRAVEGQLGPDPASGGATPVRVELPES